MWPDSPNDAMMSKIRAAYSKDRRGPKTDPCGTRVSLWKECGFIANSNSFVDLLETILSFKVLFFVGRRWCE